MTGFDARRWRRDAIAAIPVAGLHRAPRRRDRARRAAVAPRAHTIRRTSPMVTSTGRSSENVLSTTALLAAAIAIADSRRPATRSVAALPRERARRDLDLRHRQVRRLFEAALRRHERRAVEVPVRPIEVESRAVEAALVVRPLEVADQPRVQPLGLQSLKRLSLADADFAAGGKRHAANRERGAVVAT